MKKFRVLNSSWFIPHNSGSADTLLITAGDSWTFGDSLGKIYSTNKDDLPARQSQVYGRHIANYLNADWFNDGKCGGSNFEIHVSIKNYINGLNSRQKKYKKVYVIVTLTESARYGWEHEHLYDAAREYKNDIHITSKNTDGFMKHCEQAEINRFIALEKMFDIELLLARNFSTSYSNTNFGKLRLVPKNWVQIDVEKINDADIELNDLLCTGGATGMVLNNYEELHKKFKICADYKEYYIEQYDRGINLRKWLKNNKFHYHPM